MIQFNLPLGDNDITGFGDTALTMRLPTQPTVEGLDPGFTPGTDTPEIGSLPPIHGVAYKAT